MVKAVSLHKDYPGGFLRKLRIYSPSEHKKAHFLQGQENGKEENLGTGAIFYPTLITPRFAKAPMLYAMRVSWYYRENTKSRELFYAIL